MGGFCLLVELHREGGSAPAACAAGLFSVIHDRVNNVFLCQMVSAPAHSPWVWQWSQSPIWQQWVASDIISEGHTPLSTGGTSDTIWQYLKWSYWVCVSLANSWKNLNINKMSSTLHIQNIFYFCISSLNTEWDSTDKINVVPTVWFVCAFFKNPFRGHRGSIVFNRVRRVSADANMRRFQLKVG